MKQLFTKLTCFFFIISFNSFSQDKGKQYGVINKAKEFGDTAKGGDVEISHRRNSDNSIDFLYTKKKPGSYTVYYSFNNVHNTNFNNGVKKVIIKSDRGSLFKLRAINTKKGISYGSSYSVQKGIINPNINDKITYLLPVNKKETFTVKDLGLAGGYFLNKNKTKGSKNYKIKKTTPGVFTVRKGLVINIDHEHKKIIVEHEDGTYAHYSGFASKEFKVKLNQSVLPGDLLGNLKAPEDNKPFKLSFSINYIIKENEKYGRAFIEPNFLTTEGIIKLEMDKEYTSDFNEEVFFQEFTKRQKKKYLKKS